MKSIQLAVCLVLALLAAGCSTQETAPGGASGYEMGSDRFGPIPAPDPSRRISWQDCTRPIAPDGGNLMCR